MKSLWSDRASGSPIAWLAVAFLVLFVASTRFSLFNVAATGLGVILLLAAPVLAMKLSFPDESAQARGTMGYASYATMAQGFGPGFDAPRWKRILADADALRRRAPCPISEWLIITVTVPSRSIHSQSFSCVPASAGRSLKSTTGFSSLGCGGKGRRVGAMTRAMRGSASASRSTSCPTTPVLPASSRLRA